MSKFYVVGKFLFTTLRTRLSTLWDWAIWARSGAVLRSEGFLLLEVRTQLLLRGVQRSLVINDVVLLI